MRICEAPNSGLLGGGGTRLVSSRPRLASDQLQLPRPRFDPPPRQQLLQPVHLMITDTQEHILQPVAWVNIVLLAGGKERIHHCRPLSSFIGAGEHIILPAQGQRTDLVLDLVVVDLDAAVFQVVSQTGQVVFGVAQGGCQPALDNTSVELEVHPFEQGLEGRARELVTHLLALFGRQVVFTADSFNSVQVFDRLQSLLGQLTVVGASIEELTPDVRQAADQLDTRIFFEVAV